jgi:hypothetical protein
MMKFLTPWNLFYAGLIIAGLIGILKLPNALRVLGILGSGWFIHTNLNFLTLGKKKVSKPEPQNKE